MNFLEGTTLARSELAREFNISETGDPNALLSELAEYINHLIQTDFNRLVAILYRIDISEDTLNLTLKGNQGTDAGLLIARLVLERQLQKIQMRQQFKPQQDIPDDEKW
jgi:hypothetical protein